MRSIFAHLQFSGRRNGIPNFQFLPHFAVRILHFVFFIPPIFIALMFWSGRSNFAAQHSAARLKTHPIEELFYFANRFFQPETTFCHAPQTLELHSPR
jgi:hypothetical protein